MKRLFIAIFALAISAIAHGQITEHASDSVLRDAVVDASAIYASASDTSEIVKIDPATGTIIARVAAGKGAGAIASDGATLACVNRSAKTVTLVRLSDFTSIGEAAIGDGADEISALPGGGYAVVNSFSDSVTLIDAGNPATPVTISGVSSVPSGIAASEKYLAVSTRSPAAVLIYAGGSQTPAATVPVPEGPSRVVALPGDRFAVLTKTNVAVIDSASARIVANADTAARDIATFGDKLFALGASSVDVYDSSLTSITSIPVQADARTIAASAGGFVLLAPKTKSMLVCASLPEAAKSQSIAAPVQIAEAAPAPAVEMQAQEAAPVAAEPAAAKSEPATPIVEAQPSEPPAPIVVADATPAEPAPTATMEEAPAAIDPPPAGSSEPAVEPAPAVEQSPEASSTPAPEPAPEKIEVAAAAPSEPAPAEATAEQAATTSDEQPAEKPAKGSKYKSKSKPWPERKSRIRPGGEVPQPEMAAPTKPKSKRPDVTPMDSGVTKETGIGQTVTDSISAPPAEGGFTPPTSADKFLDVQAESYEQREDGVWVGEGNVRFTLLGAPDVKFAADYLEYDPKTGRIFVSGDVEIVQGPSTAFADEIETTVYPGSTKLRTPPPLTGALDTEDDLTKKLLSIGSLNAKNIDIIEPSRRVRAEKLVYDFNTQSGYMYDMEGQVGQIRFGGDELQMEGENAGGGKNLWLTTCDCDHEYYRVHVKELGMDQKGGMIGKGAQLEIGNRITPLYWPRWAYSGGPTPTAGFDFTSGKKAELGYYINVGQQFAVSPDFQLGYRLFPTTKEGVGFGFDGTYDYMQTPSSPLFRSSGEFHALYTTEDRGYYEWYHRHELTPNTVMLMNFEQWGDENFYKDFYYDRYKDRTAPRNFVNVTYTQPGYIATATVNKDTHDFVNESERLPEATFHLLERELLPRVYLTFDTVDGYYERESAEDEAFRSINVARLSTDLELGALNLVPFLELEASYYSKTREKGNDEEDSDARLSSLAGVTAQTRFQRAYDGKWGFSGFKHIVVPSLTYSYRNEPTMDVEETPRFDAYDNVYGRSRVELKLDNIVMGRDAETGETWQVARLSLYQGNDLWNEIRESTDYEIELDLRPRSWWGVEIIGEHHSIDNEGDIDIDAPYLLQRGLIELYERVLDEPFDADTAAKYNTRYGDYDRILTYMYYDNRDFGGNLNGRIGYAYTKTQDEVFNREVLYGLGYKINEKWSVAFEHRFDLERGELYRQKYEVRRVMNCLEGALLVNERGSGWDFGVELSVTGIPGTRIRF